MAIARRRDPRGIGDSPVGEWIILAVAAWYLTKRYDVRAWGERLVDTVLRSPWLQPGGRARVGRLLRGAYRDVLELARDATLLIDRAAWRELAGRPRQSSLAFGSQLDSPPGAGDITPGEASGRSVYQRPPRARYLTPSTPRRSERKVQTSAP